MQGFYVSDLWYAVSLDSTAPPPGAGKLVRVGAPRQLSLVVTAPPPGAGKLANSHSRLGLYHHTELRLGLRAPPRRIT